MPAKPKFISSLSVNAKTESISGSERPTAASVNVTKPTEESNDDNDDDDDNDDNDNDDDDDDDDDDSAAKSDASLVIDEGAAEVSSPEADGSQMTMTKRPTEQQLKLNVSKLKHRMKKFAGHLKRPGSPNDDQQELESSPGQTEVETPNTKWDVKDSKTEKLGGAVKFIKPSIAKQSKSVSKLQEWNMFEGITPPLMVQPRKRKTKGRQSKEAPSVKPTQPVGTSFKIPSPLSPLPSALWYVVFIGLM